MSDNASSYVKSIGGIVIGGGGLALLIWQAREIRKLKLDTQQLRHELRQMEEDLMDRVEMRLSNIPNGEQLEKINKISQNYSGIIQSWSTSSITSNDMYDDANEEWYNDPAASSSATVATASGDTVLPQVAMDAIDKLLEDNAQKAYDEMKKLYNGGGSKDPELLWRFAKACHSIASDYDKKNPKKKELILEGRGYAQTAASIAEDKFIVLKWAAILTGTATDYVGTKEKIEQGSVFKSYLDKALAKDAKEFSLLHMRGRYAFSVANLSWLERKAAAAFYAAPPNATIDEALRDFLAAHQVRPQWIENVIYIARCYIALKDSKNASHYLKEVIALEPTDDSEKELIEEAKTLLKKYPS